MDHRLINQAEAFLFTEGGSLTKKRLAHLLQLNEAALTEVLAQLTEALRGRGLSLIVSDTEVTLAVSADASPTIRAAYQKELEKDIGDAGLEVLAIILYRGPSTRAQIDYIRGVNTSSTIRTLLSRGLIERTGNPDDAREYLYRPTVELLAHLGVTSTTALPEHDTLAHEINAFEATQTHVADADAQRL